MRCCALHAWLGGGFGMFSTVDERHFRAFWVGAEGERPVELSPELEDAAERVEALPSEARLRALAGALAAEPAPGGAVLRAEVWETRFDAAMRPSPRLIAAVVVDPDSEPR